MKSKESVLKCPSCSEILPALANVCPSCNYVIAARNEGEAITLQELVYRIEHTLADVKALPHPNALTLIRKNIYAFCIYIGLLLALTTYILKVKDYNDDIYGPIGYAASFTIMLSLIAIMGKNTAESDRKNQALERGIQYTEDDKSKEKTFKELKAEFEKSKRLAKIFFGEDPKVKMLIEELNDEINKEETKVIKASKSIKFLYIAFGLLLLVPILIPEHSYESTYSGSGSSTSGNADFAPITIQGSSIESTGNIGSKLEVKIPEAQINFSATQVDYKDKVSVQLPIKFSVKQGEKSKLSQEVNAILNGCKVSDYENRTLRNCAKITASIALSTGSGSPSGIKLYLTAESDRELLSALESSSDDFVLTFYTNIDPKDLNNARSSGGGTVNLILSKEDN